MFIVLLKFSDNRAQASQWMAEHNGWLKQGFMDDVFLLAGSLQPQQGGTIIAHNISRPELESRVADDPFVAENVVRAEILEITPARVDARLSFLMAGAES